MNLLIERAPAKVNLSLHIIGRREDSLHALESLVCFSACGDTLSLMPGKPLSLQVSGPYADAAGDINNNLVLIAARAFLDEFPDAATGQFHLHKYLPAAAGIGGGSSDAAATLRLLARANNMALDDRRLLRAAAVTGADVPVCLNTRARMMAGIGDDLGPLLQLPPLFAVLVNPGVPVETGKVFARLGLAPGETYSTSKHPDIGTMAHSAGLFAALRRTRNDMEGAASLLAPVITDVLAVLGAARRCKLARMSGSGATCFGLFETRTAASRASRAIRTARPQWWVKPCVLR